MARAPLATTAHAGKKKEKIEMQKSVEKCDVSLALDPKDAYWLRRRAEAKRKLGQYKEAVFDFDAALSADPQSHAAFAGRGAARKALGKFKDAIADFDAALKLQPDTVAVLIGRGGARRALGQNKQALVDLDDAIRQEPRNASALQLRGETRRKLGDCNGAIADFNTALRVQPQFAAALAGRGAARKSLGQHREAITDYNEALKLEPKGGAFFSGRGACLLELGRHSEAIVDFERAMKLDPKDPFAAWGHSEASKKAGEQMLQTVSLHGFAHPELNTRFIERRDLPSKVGKKETYWAQGRAHFLWYSKVDDRWKCSKAADIDKIRSGRSPSVLGAPVGEDLFCTSRTVGWHEWDGASWQHRPDAGIASLGRISAAAAEKALSMPAPTPAVASTAPARQRPEVSLRTFTLVGFRSQHQMNTKFTERNEPEFAVYSFVTYWSMDSKFFIYWCEPEERWKGSRVEHLSKIQAGGSSGVIAAPHGEDLFGVDRRKGWHEWDGFAWVSSAMTGIQVMGVATAAPVAKRARR